jgi:hypothetical protein
MRISLLAPIVPFLLLTAFACGDSGGSDTAAGGSAGAMAGGASGSGGSSAGGKGGSAGSAAGGKGGSAGTSTSGGSSSTAGDSGDAGEGNGGAVGSPPTATINHPADGEPRNVDEDIPFIGVGVDAEDGNLTGASLLWTSSIEGQIGTGENFNAPLAQAGMHTITLTVTDSDGNEGTDSITLDVQ